MGDILNRPLLLQVKALGDKGSDLDISCSEPELGGTHESFPIAFDKMQRTVFCLVPPGDAQSTRRLSELFMSGCIPVFLGPPFNTMPFGEDIPYASIGVFFNFTDYSTWLKKVSCLGKSSFQCRGPQLSSTPPLADLHQIFVKPKR